MKYSYIWLKELSGTKLSPEKLANLLTMKAFELEEMKKEGKETQLVFDILANRGHDALSHIGMAREICAAEGRKLRSPSIQFYKMENGAKSSLNIEIRDKKLCRRYIGAMIENIKVGPSPKWIQDRLLVSGVKPINNVVDITNYTMLETGQPLHAFDADKTSGNIIVRKAQKKEKLMLLDETEYELGENNLVIADSKKALALAGVMGGAKSSVTKRTKKIILESANFDPVNVRKTRVRLGLNTESSYRFERSIDPNLAQLGAARAIELLQKYGGKNVKIAALTDVYPKKVVPWVIKLNADYVKSLLGENIAVSKMKSILENLGIVVKLTKNILTCEIPTRRIDLKTLEDLIEEIGRILGYDNISAKAPAVELSLPHKNEKGIFEDDLRDAMIALGFSEMLNYSFYSENDIKKCGLDPNNHFEVANPMNPDQRFMRTSLIPGILKNIRLNLKNFDKVSIFEIGRKFLDENKNLPAEKTVLAGALADASKRENAFFELKGRIEALLQKLGLEKYEFRSASPEKFWHPTRTALILVDRKEIGKIGEIHPKVLASYGIKQRVSAFGIGVEKLIEFVSIDREYRSIFKFPSVKRDISMFVDEKTKYADIENKIHNAGGKLVLDVDLFDIFEKEGEKSMALRVEIGSRQKTLTSDEIDAVMKKIIQKLEKDLKVKVRK